MTYKNRPFNIICEPHTCSTSSDSDTAISTYGRTKFFFITEQPHELETEFGKNKKTFTIDLLLPEQYNIKQVATIYLYELYTFLCTRTLYMYISRYLIRSSSPSTSATTLLPPHNRWPTPVVC